MSVVEVPLTVTDSSFVQEITLDNTTYRATFRWNARESEWYMTLADIEDTVIRSGIKLVAGASFLRHAVNYDVRPPGELMLLGVATRDNLGIDATLVYLDEDELT